MKESTRVDWEFMEIGANSAHQKLISILSYGMTMVPISKISMANPKPL